MTNPAVLWKLSLSLVVALTLLTQMALLPCLIGVQAYATREQIGMAEGTLTMDCAMSRVSMSISVFMVTMLPETAAC